MNNNYKVMAEGTGHLSLVDMRGNPDLSGYEGVVVSGWKKILPARIRNYHARRAVLSAEGPLLLGYPKNKYAVVDPRSGDYIPPGYTSLSCQLDSDIFLANRSSCRIVPIGPRKILGGDSFTRECTTSAGVRVRAIPAIDSRQVPFWRLSFSSPEGRRWATLITDADGTYCSTDGALVVASQSLLSEIFEGDTSIRVRVTGDPVTVLIGASTLTQDDEGIWEWTGDPITEDVMLSIVIGSNKISNVEVL